MTTSWAWFVRGNLAASLWVQPMGTVLAILAAITFWTALYVAVSGRAAYQLLRYLPGKYVVPPLLAWAVMAWGWKILIHLHHWDGWQ